MVKKKRNLRNKKFLDNVSTNMAPSGVKIISVLAYVKAFFLFVIGIGLFIGGVIGLGDLGSISVGEILELIGNTTNAVNLALASFILKSLILGGVVLIGLSIVAFYVGKGLWNGKDWARIFTIVLMVILFVNSLALSDLITLIVSGLIGGYLLFNNSAKSYFVK